MKKNLNKIAAIVVGMVSLFIFIINMFVTKFISMNQQLIIELFLVGLIILLLSKNNRLLFNIGLVIVLSSLLMWNFLLNNIGIFNNKEFYEFQSDSEAFAINAVFAKEGNVYDKFKFGLCYYYLENNQAYPYLSQFGLQGKVFSFIYSLANSLLGISSLAMIEIYHTLVSFITAIVLSIITVLVNKKTNIVLSICFYVTFLFSPWVVNFARNLYWVEFTWFIPMIIGLICSINVDNKRIRILSYILSFISILIKCLCGYEYLSTIMIASVSFLLVDYIKAIINKDANNRKLLFKTIFIMGLCEVLGFVIAISLHSLYRGDGSIISGIATIYKEDILRRTFGGNATNFDQTLANSLNASVWTVLGMYLRFNTNIISFIPKEAFTPMYVLALIVALYDIKNKKYDSILYYVVYFLAAISWIVLAKSHSYEHTHINFIVWYFGFIQICLYILVNKIITLLKK